jgi:hypothetical protein
MTKPIAVALSALLTCSQLAIAEEKPSQQGNAKERIEADEARGYKHVPFDDLFLDYKQLPVGSKRAVAALYQVFGQYETLTALPSESAFDGVPRIPLLTDKAPRDVRKRLLAPMCRTAFCKVVFLGRTAPCTALRTRFGDTHRTTCFVVEEMW